MTFEQCVEFVLAQEGEYSNDPQDSGKETKYGISKATFPELDIPALTREQAIGIYKEKYWNRCRCSELPNGLDLIVFDTAVNQGTRRAILMLQQSLNVTDDGVVGAITIRAAHNKPQIISEYLARRMYAYALIPQCLRYGLGWFRRLSRVAELAYHH